MKNKTANSIRPLVESALFIALATVLSLIKLVDLPYGGSVTIACMLPMVLLSYRWGIKWGLGAGLVFGVLQQLLGLNTLSWVTTWQSILAVILLDYVIAYAFTGLGGIFRKTIKNQATALALGATLVCLLRYICHVISGATVWAGISIPTAAATVYSLVYNATYMLPETLITVIVACYLGSTVDFSKERPTRIAPDSVSTGKTVLSALAGLICAGVLVFDIAAIFSKLQNAETGEFAIAQISQVNWIAVLCVTVIGALVAGALFAVRAASKSTK